MFSAYKYDEELSIGGDFELAVSNGAGVSISGDNGVSIVGPGGVAKSGVGGMLVFFDDSYGARIVTVGYIGVNGIEPDQFYEFDGAEIVISTYDC